MLALTIYSFYILIHNSYCDLVSLINETLQVFRNLLPGDAMLCNVFKGYILPKEAINYKAFLMILKLPKLSKV